MSLHDAYARRTPFELAFPDAGAVERLIAEIEEEADGRGADPSDPQAFITMGAVGAFIREIQGPDAPPEALHRYGALVFHAVHFASAGSPVFVLGADAARHLVSTAPEGSPTPPGSCGYLQLPQHLFWTGSDEGAPESIDGLFWTLSSNGLMHVLLITGVRPDRTGFGAVPLPEAPLADASGWLDVQVRDGAADFSSALPGGELDELYSVEAAGEALKLLARFFAYISTAPGAIEQHPAGRQESSDPPASALPFSRVTYPGAAVPHEGQPDG
jgi:hypothetical protein